jgi:hypothetical protein
LQENGRKLRSDHKNCVGYVLVSSVNIANDPGQTLSYLCQNVSLLLRIVIDLSLGFPDGAMYRGA